MKYADYKQHADAYRAKSDKHHKAFEPIAVEMYRLSDMLRREYLIGKSIERSWMPETPICVYLSWNSTPAVYVMIAGNLVHDFIDLTAAQITKIAEIRRVAEQWMTGEIDELPPSGEWPTT